MLCQVWSVKCRRDTEDAPATSIQPLLRYCVPTLTPAAKGTSANLMLGWLVRAPSTSLMRFLAASLAAVILVPAIEPVVSITRMISTPSETPTCFFTSAVPLIVML